MAGGRGIGPNVVERPSEVAFQEIKRRHAKTSELTVHPGHLNAALAQTEKAAVIVVVTEKYPLAGFDFPDESQHRLIQMLTRQHRAPVMSWPACVAAAVGVLCGVIRPQGRLPVSVPGLYLVGWGSDSQEQRSSSDVRG